MRFSRRRDSMGIRTFFWTVPWTFKLNIRRTILPYISPNIPRYCPDNLPRTSPGQSPKYPSLTLPSDPLTLRGCQLSVKAHGLYVQKWMDMFPYFRTLCQLPTQLSGWVNKSKKILIIHTSVASAGTFSIPSFVLTEKKTDDIFFFSLFLIIFCGIATKN